MNNQTHHRDDPLFKPDEAADYLRTTVATLATWRYRGAPKLRYLKRGRAVLYRKSDLDAFLDAHVREHT